MRDPAFWVPLAAGLSPHKLGSTFWTIPVQLLAARPPSPPHRKSAMADNRTKSEFFSPHPSRASERVECRNWSSGPPRRRPINFALIDCPFEVSRWKEDVSEEECFLSDLFARSLNYEVIPIASQTASSTNYVALFTH